VTVNGALPRVNDKRPVAATPKEPKKGECMINTLLSINADLASSIAFRYACRLAGLIDMQLQTIHVEEVETEKYPPGSGWVRSTWEDGLLQSSREEIAQLINADKTSCPPLNTSILRIGDREEELLREIKKQSYDLLLEGVLSSFDGQPFHNRIRSKLYRYVPCPIIVVKNLAQPNRVALAMADVKDVVPVVSTFLKLFDNTKTTVDLCYCDISGTDAAGVKQRIADGSEADEEAGRRVITDAMDLLATKGWTPEANWIIRDKPARIGEMLDDYGLVGARIPRSAHQRSLMTDLLCQVPSATLLVK
jgi:hypothetical protein